MSASMNPRPCDVSIYFSACTEKGRSRALNEDSFLIADLTTGGVESAASAGAYSVGPRGVLLAVSDGMGGAVGGEVASQLGVTFLHETLLSLSNKRDIAVQMRLAAMIANWRVYNHAQQNPGLIGMGTTLTAAIVRGSAAYISQIGDSRAYLIRGESIKQLTRDQTFAQLLLEKGIIESEKIAPMHRDMLAQALGTEPSVEVAITSAELCRNDHLLVCSDGLSNKVASEEIKQTVRDATNLSAACRRLADLAIERGGEDDITVILARVEGAALESSGDRAITGSLTWLSEFIA